MASWLAAQYNGVLVLGTSMVFVPFLASFGPQGGPVWHHLGRRATPFGALGTHGGTWFESSKTKRPKKPERALFWDPFLDTFSPKSCKVSPQRLPWNRACQNAFNWCLSWPLKPLHIVLLLQRKCVWHSLTMSSKGLSKN